MEKNSQIDMDSSIDEARPNRLPPNNDKFIPSHSARTPNLSLKASIQPLQRPWMNEQLPEKTKDDDQNSFENKRNNPPRPWLNYQLPQRTEEHQIHFEYEWKNSPYTSNKTRDEEIFNNISPENNTNESFIHFPGDGGFAPQRHSNDTRRQETYSNKSNHQIYESYLFLNQSKIGTNNDYGICKTLYKKSTDNEFYNNTGNKYPPYHHAVHACKSDETMYKDEHFPADIDSIKGGKDIPLKLNLQHLVWKRLGDFSKLCPEETFGVFGNRGIEGIDITDVEQGELGNCYFVASLASLSTHYKMVANLISVIEPKNADTNIYGAYCVSLCLNGFWEYIVIDDRVPCSPLTGLPVFTKFIKYKIWPILIEKAYSKLMGGYFNTVAGTCMEGMHLLTGAPVENVKIKQTPKSKFQAEIAKIHSYAKKMFIMTASTGQSIDDSGLIPTHAFSLLDVKCLRKSYSEFIYDGDWNGQTSNLKSEDVLLVKLRNPWADKDKWKGKWSFSDSIWNEHPNLKKRLDYQTKSSGVVYMEMEDFFKYFEEYDVCFVRDDYTYSYSQFPSGRDPMIINIEIKKEGYYTFGYSQINPRKVENDNRHSFSRVSLILAKFGENSNGLEYIQGVAYNRLHLFLEEQLMREGKYQLILTTNWLDHEEFKGTLTCYGVEKVNFEVRRDSKENVLELIHHMYTSKALKAHRTMSNFQKGVGSSGNLDFTHQLMKDGFGYFFFINKSADKICEVLIIFDEFFNLAFMDDKYNYAIGNNYSDSSSAKRTLIININPDSNSLILYKQLNVPNKIKFTNDCTLKYPIANNETNYFSNGPDNWKRFGHLDPNKNINRMLGPGNNN